MKKSLLLAIILVFLITPIQVPMAQGAALDYNKSPKLANLYFKWEISDTQARELAKWDILMIDMEVQHYSPNSLRKIRQYNPDIKLLAYLAAQEVRVDSYKLDGTLRKKFYKQIESEWWLRDTYGRQVAWWPTNPIINVSTTSPTVNGKRYYDVFPWFVKNEIMSSGLWDGVFLDNVWEDISFLYDHELDLNQDGIRESKAQMVDSWNKGMETLMSNTRNVLGPEAIVIGNGGESYYKFLNGALYEHFPDRGWAPTMKKYHFISAEGFNPGVGILNSNVNNNGNKSDYRTMRFGLTSSLLSNGFYSFDNGDQSHNEIWWYDEYEAYLGKPLGNATNLTGSSSNLNEGIWRRDFEKGIVVVNSTWQNKNIDLKGHFEKIHGKQDKSVNSGAIISQVTLPARDGIILYRTQGSQKPSVIKPAGQSVGNIKGVAFTNGSFARYYDRWGQVKRTGNFLYEESFAGSSQVLIANLDKKGSDEILVAGDSKVEIFSTSGLKLSEFYPYEKHYNQGINIAIGDLDHNGTLEIITGTENGGGPHVRIFNHTGKLINPGFFAYGKEFRGGVNLAVGDLDGNGTLEIIAGAGVGGGPHVRVFNEDAKLINPGFFAYDESFRGGVNVAVGDLDGNGKDEIITGPGRGGGPHVRIYNNKGQIQFAQFFAFNKSLGSGVEVLATDIDGDGRDDIVATSSDVFAVSGLK